jgi:hypothetical protein
MLPARSVSMREPADIPDSKFQIPAAVRLTPRQTRAIDSTIARTRRNKEVPLKPKPNICPLCKGPLTGDAQCIFPKCENFKACEYCGARLNIYRVCPNTACPNSLKRGSTRTVPPPPGHEMFTRTTMDFTVPNVTCETCGKKYEAVFLSCPHCAERMASETDEPFSDDPKKADVHHRLTIPCPMPPPSFDPARPSGKKQDILRKSSSPKVEIRIEDADELEPWEAEEILKGEKT